MDVQELLPSPRVGQNLVVNMGMGDLWKEPRVNRPLQEQQATKNTWLFQALAQTPKTVLEVLVVTQAQANP